LDEKDKNPDISINFIPVCCNYLRHSLEQIQEHLLHHWYKAGIACYSHVNLEVFDIVVPVHYKQAAASEHGFCPLLIRIKWQSEVHNNERESAKDAMVCTLENAGIEVGLCMLLLVGLKTNETKPVEMDIDKEMYEKISLFSGNGILAFTVEIPVDEPFGVNRFLEQTSTAGGERAELYASHARERAEIYASHAQVCWSPSLDTEKLLRATTKDESDSFMFLSKLKTAYLKSPLTDDSRGTKRKPSNAD